MKKINRLINNLKYLLNNDCEKEIKCLISKSIKMDGGLKNNFPKSTDEYISVITQGGNQLLMIDGIILPKIETTTITQEPLWNNGLCHVEVSFFAKLVE